MMRKPKMMSKTMMKSTPMMTAGAGGGLGRIEKSDAAAKQRKIRK